MSLPVPKQYCERTMLNNPTTVEDEEDEEDENPDDIFRQSDSPYNPYDP